MGGKISRSRLEKLVENLSRELDFSTKSDPTTLRGDLRPVVDINSATSVTAAQSGAIFAVDLASGGYTVALPTPEVGLYYTFVVTADNNGDVKIISTTDGSTEANLILVSLQEAQLGPVQTASQSSVTFDASEAGTMGSALHFYCIGTSNPAWFCEGYTSVANELDTGTA